MLLLLSSTMQRGARGREGGPLGGAGAAAAALRRQRNWRRDKASWPVAGARARCALAAVLVRAPASCCLMIGGGGASLLASASPRDDTEDVDHNRQLIEKRRAFYPSHARLLPMRVRVLVAVAFVAIAFDRARCGRVRYR